MPALRRARPCAERLIVEADIDLRGIGATGLDQIGEVGAGILASQHRVERDRDSGVENDAVK